MPAGAARKPEWLRVKLTDNENTRAIRSLVRSGELHTVCEEARCPNLHECWGERRTATFMILGDICTRRCRFCAVGNGTPRPVDSAEPLRVAGSVRAMGLAHAVITMVNRDDLSDGGAGLMAATVRAIRQAAAGCSVEVLCSDLMGSREAIRVVVESRPDVMSHNIETVRRLTPRVRSRSSYDRSLEFLRIARAIDPAATTKSSLMLGLGESREEVLEAMDDLLAAGASMMNLGQYLQPTRAHVPVARYWTPGEFDELKRAALDKGFVHVEAGPLVRSSYHAGAQYDAYRSRLAPRADQT